MRIPIISDILDAIREFIYNIKWEINFWKNPTLHKLKLTGDGTLMGLWKLITWPIHVIWWILVVILFRPIRWIFYKSSGVKTKKDGSVDHRYKDEDEDEDRDAETAETAETANEVVTKN